MAEHDLTESESEPARPGHRGAWLVSYTTACLLSFVATGAALVALAETDALSEPLLGHWTSVRFDRRIEAHTAAPPLADSQQIAVLGDSTVASYRHDERVPDYIRRSLTKGAEGRRFRVADLSFIGAGTVTEYFWADHIVAMNPDLVIWEVSLLHFSDSWLETSLRPELAGFMAFRRFCDLIRLPLGDLRVRLDDFLMSQLIVRAGWIESVGRLAEHQRNLRAGREEIERAIAAHPALGAEARFRAKSRIRRMARHQRPTGDLNLAGERHYLGAALDGLHPSHPVLQVLAAALVLYQENDIDVLVYLTPIDMDHLESVGAIHGDALRRSVALVRETAESAGASFLDLHDLLPTHAFGRMAHHYTSPPEFEALVPLSTRIVEVARPMLDARASRDRSSD